LLLPTSETGGSRCIESATSEVDEATQAFNLWTHRIHTFFVQKFVPAARNYFEVQTRLEAERQRKLAGISIESCRQVDAVSV
jgi:hypothetical protein